MININNQQKYNSLSTSHVLAVVIIFICFLSPFSSKAEINFSGFASIVAGQTLAEEDIFLADAVGGGKYDHSLSFNPESVFALQASVDMLDDLTFTAQLVSRGASDFDIGVEWAFLSYSFNNHWKLKVGRQGVKIYQYSDYLEVGYAYDFMRPPLTLYFSPLSHYDGISITYQNMLFDTYAYEIQLFSGQSGGDATYTSEVTGIPVRIDLEKTNGINSVLYGDVWEFKLGYTQVESNLNFAGFNFFNDAVAASYISTSFYYEQNNFVFNLEGSLYEDEGMFNDLLTYFTSFGYRLGAFTPTIGYSFYDEELTSLPSDGRTLRGPPIDYAVTSFTLRYDFHTNAALKLDYSVYRDKGEIPYIGDAEVISFGVDLVF